MKKGFTLKGKKLNLLVIGIIMISIVGTKAATAINSSMVTYNDTTVKETLDDLMDITVKGTATSADIASGKTAVVKGELITGTAAQKNSSISFEVRVPATAYRVMGNLPVGSYKYLDVSFIELGSGNSLKIDCGSNRTFYSKTTTNINIESCSSLYYNFQENTSNNIAGHVIFTFHD